MSAQPGPGRRTLDPDAPGLDEDTRFRRRALQKLARLSREELFEVAVSAGIFTPDGELTEHYREDAPPSLCRLEGYR